MYDVVSIGSAVLDLTISSKELRVMKSHQVAGGVALCEVYGGKTEVGGVEVSVGGGGTNAGVSFLKKGLKVATVSKIAKDEIGRLIKARLMEHKLDLSLLIETDKGKSALAVILVAADGGRAILVYRGVAKELSSAQIDWERLKQTQWLYISSLGGQLSVWEDILAFAAREGIKVAANPGKAELVEKERLRELLPKLEVLILNRMELAGFLRVDFEDDDRIEAGIKRLGTKIVVMTEGKRGSRAYRVGEKVKAAAFKVKTLDETGAGDAFGSGLVYGLIKGESLATSLKLGAANAAGEVMKMGTKDGLLTEVELGRWMKKKLEIVEAVW